MSAYFNKQLQMSWSTESIALAKPFRISRGTKTHAEVVVLTIKLGVNKGWAEAVPYARYSETVASTCAVLEDLNRVLQNFEAPSGIVLIEIVQRYINKTLVPSSAKSLLDCALWDLKAKMSHKSVNHLLGVEEVKQVVSAQTLSVDTLDVMLADAKKMSHLPLIKIKLDANDIVTKMVAIHKACPRSQFIIDANEAWSFDALNTALPSLRKLNVALIEQPLPADADEELKGFSSPIALCADESCHTSAELALLATKYNMVNIKLDKTGGLSEALALAKSAKALHLQVMLGCMVASSLAMAPIFTLASYANFVDLDGPILVAKDRDNGFVFTDAHMRKPANFLWGEE